jgi:catechol 2,3-dioxygenase-like lactoylglutathione lyase family enzyme
MFAKKPVTEGLGSRKIVAFVATVDPVRAKTFYAGSLGLRLVSEDQFALVFDAGGTRLRISVVREHVPAGYTVLGWLVPDIEQAVRELAARSVVFQRFDGMTHDELGIWTAPGGAKVAWFRDPDGNTLSVTQA